jgi:hypothetical protein
VGTFDDEGPMTIQVHPAAERAIADLLLAQWDPLGVRDIPGPHAEYAIQAHAVYGLLARGASSVQIERYLHQVASEQLNHPELATADLRSLLRELRTVNLDG